MKRLLFWLVCLIGYLQSTAQITDSLRPAEHTYYLEMLNSSRDSLYDKALREYDTYLATHHHDVQMHIERCKLIEFAYYDEYEGYSLNYEEADSCRSKLKKEFPHSPEVKLFLVEHLYGDEKVEALKELVEDVQEQPERWKHLPVWKVHQQLANEYKWDDNYEEAISHAKLAMEQNDTLDLSILLAEGYIELDEKEKAVEILLNGVDSTQSTWDINRKGKLLLDLGKTNEALDVFNYIKEDTNGYINYSDLAATLVENGLFNEAREYLVKDLNERWPQAKAKFDLFQFDLKYGTADSTKASYERLVEDSFSNDFLGKYRLLIFLKHPLLSWSFPDIGRVLLLLLSLLIIVFLPYVWVLPVDYMGRALSRRGFYFFPNNFRWNLKHFWIISSIHLFIIFMCYYVFSYEAFMSYLTDVYVGETIEDISQKVADNDLLFSFSLLFTTLFFVSKLDVIHFWGNKWSKQHSILLGFAVGFVIRAIYGTISLEFDLYDAEASFYSAVTDSILSVNEYYSPILGFIVVAVMAPFYEEIIFRGVVLAGLEKKIPFVWANLLQALLFMGLHDDVVAFPFLFAFGFAAGMLRNKSQSLAPGMAMHFLNNAIAFWVITARG